MTENEALVLIKEILVKTPGVQKPVTDGSYLLKDLGLQSIELLSLLVDIERAAGGEIDMVQLLRDRDPSEAYSRDFSVSQLAKALVKAAGK